MGDERFAIELEQRLGSAHARAFTAGKNNGRVVTDNHWRSICPISLRFSSSASADRPPCSRQFLNFLDEVGKTPLFKNGAGRGRYGSGRFRCARQSTVKQPLFECSRIWILAHRALEQIALDRPAHAVRRLVALAVAPASLGRFKRGEQRSANRRGPNH